MTIASIAILTAAVALLAWDAIFGGRLPRRFRGRSCQGRDWRRNNPGATKSEIREFLSSFVGAFGFNKSEKLKLNPNDKLLEIYRALYPSRMQPDALELEALALDLRSRYGLDLAAIWSGDLTLGELFIRTRK